MGIMLQVNNPVAPTGEVLEALKALNAPVKHIVISSNSVEHWVFAEKFASHFPDAKVWAPPGKTLGDDSESRAFMTALLMDLGGLVTRVFWRKTNFGDLARVQHWCPHRHRVGYAQHT